MPFPSIIVDEKAKENGLAMMLADLMKQNMEQRPEKVFFFNLLKAVVAITAKDADVKLTIFFNRGSCIVYDGIVGRPDLHIVADSENIMGLSAIPIKTILPDIKNAASRDLAKKIFQGKVKIHGVLFHPLTLICISNVFSVN